MSPLLVGPDVTSDAPTKTEVPGKQDVCLHPPNPRRSTAHSLPSLGSPRSWPPWRILPDHPVHNSSSHDAQLPKLLALSRDLISWVLHRRHNAWHRAAPSQHGEWLSVNEVLAQELDEIRDATSFTKGLGKDKGSVVVSCSFSHHFYCNYSSSWVLTTPSSGPGTVSNQLTHSEP